MKTTPTLAGALTTIALVLSIAGPWPSAHAARPLVTDDARIVDPKSCQLETWLRFNRDGTERWALPGCNLPAISS